MSESEEQFKHLISGFDGMSAEEQTQAIREKAAELNKAADELEEKELEKPVSPRRQAELLGECNTAYSKLCVISEEVDENFAADRTKLAEASKDFIDALWRLEDEGGLKFTACPVDITQESVVMNLLTREELNEAVEESTAGMISPCDFNDLSKAYDKARVDLRLAADDVKDLREKLKEEEEVTKRVNDLYEKTQREFMTARTEALNLRETIREVKEKSQKGIQELLDKVTELETKLETAKVNTLAEAQNLRKDLGDAQRDLDTERNEHFYTRKERDEFLLTTRELDSQLQAVVEYAATFNALNDPRLSGKALELIEDELGIFPPDEDEEEWIPDELPEWLQELPEITEDPDSHSAIEFRKADVLDLPPFLEDRVNGSPVPGDDHPTDPGHMGEFMENEDEKKAAGIPSPRSRTYKSEEHSEENSSEEILDEDGPEEPHDNKTWLDKAPTWLQKAIGEEK